MIGKDDIASIIEDYDRLKLRVGMTASHSALDICDGAIEEGFPTVAYCQKDEKKPIPTTSKLKEPLQEELDEEWLTNRL